MGIKSIAGDFLSDTANRWMVAVFLIASYLVLFNLGNAPLWHDEVTPALMGKLFLNNFNLNAWDGRTMYVGINGTAVNSDLRIASFPPWPMLPSALGIAIFGVNDFGTRIFHSLLGLASLWLFWRLLRLDFANQPRLRVFAFTLFALSTQVILFMRMGRYIADACFFTLLAFYAYRLYIAPGGKTWHLALAALATLLNFFNHFAIGASFALALGIWHGIYHWRHTTRRQWMEIAIAGAVIIVLCLWYLWWMKIILSDETLEFGSSHYQLPLLERKWILVVQNFRDMMRFGLLPVWVAIWFVMMMAHRAYPWAREVAYPRLKPVTDVIYQELFKSDHEVWKEKEYEGEVYGEEEYGEYEEEMYEECEEETTAPAAQYDDGMAQLFRWSVLGALFLVFSGIFSVRSPVSHGIADTRYIAPVLFFTALLCAAFVDWLWRRRGLAGKFMGIMVVVILLETDTLWFPYALLCAAFADWLWRWRAEAAKCGAMAVLVTFIMTNALWHPYAHHNFFTHENRYALLPNLIKEIHRPYQNYMKDALDYLRVHIQQDETIHVHPRQEFEIMQFYLSDKLIFCCALNGNSPLNSPLFREKLEALGLLPLYSGEVEPDWMVISGSVVDSRENYELVLTSSTYAQPTNRPELELHTFAPIDHPNYRFRVYRKKPQEAEADAGTQ